MADKQKHWITSSRITFFRCHTKDSQLIHIVCLPPNVPHWRMGSWLTSETGNPWKSSTYPGTRKGASESITKRSRPCLWAISFMNVAEVKTWLTGCHLRPSLNMPLAARESWAGCLTTRASHFIQDILISSRLTEQWNSCNSICRQRIPNAANVEASAWSAVLSVTFYSTVLDAVPVELFC